MAVEAPAMGVPPAIETFVFPPDGFGAEVRETGLDFALALDGPSDMRYPAEVCCCFGGGGAATGFGLGFGVLDRETSALLGPLDRLGR